MGRRSYIDKYKLITFDNVRNVSTCLICGARLRGLLLSNIKRHYVKLHGYSFEGREMTVPKVLPPVIKRRRSSCSELEMSLSLSKEQFLKCCIGLVAMRNVRLELFNDDEYFKPLIEPYEQAFGTDLNAGTMSEQIAEGAGKIREQLRKSFKNQLMSLKADIVTTQTGENKLLLTVHYLKDFIAQAHTIGVISLPAEQLSEHISACLADFGIDVSQIYSFVSDYGPFGWLHDKETIENEYETVHSLLKNYFGAIRCTRQIFALAAFDTIKDFHTALAGCRLTVDSLQKHVRSVSAADNEFAPVTVKDDGSNWLSTYEMIESMLNARSYINLYNVEECLSAPWVFGEKFVDAFKPMVECLNNVKPNEYIVGDFYRDWLLCEAKLEIMQNNRVAENLLASMLKWKEELLGDQAFAGALYLDPRFNYLDSPFWTEAKRKLAVQHLLKTISQINSVNQKIQPDLGQALADETSNQSSETLEDPFKELEMKVRSISNNKSCASTQLSHENVAHLIDKLSNTQRVPFATNILEYWKMCSMKERELVDLAQVVLAMPTTQAAAVLALDTLSEILANQSTEMTYANVQDTLMIKLNPSLFKKL